MMDLDQWDLDENNGNILTLEADEKLIAIEGTYCGFENRTVVGQCKMTTLYNGKMRLETVFH